MKGRWAYGLCLVFCALMHLSFLRAQEPILLEPSVVSASRPLVKAVGDTLVFNPDALPLEDDASLEDLLKMIPGLAVEGGEVTLYGRRIEKMLVGGKLYFGGDVAAGLRNLRAEEIESVASYQRPSDFARISGIDDGEEEPVLDVKIKKQFLNRHDIRLKCVNQLLHILIDQIQPAGQLRMRRRRDNAAVNQLLPAAICFEYTEAHNGNSGINSQYSHEIPPV